MADLIDKLDPESFYAFENSIRDLPEAETRLRKAGLMREIIESYGQDLKKYQKIMIAMGIVSVLFLPLFFVSIPIYSIYLSTNRLKKQKIRWALNRWQGDLKEDYDLLFEKLTRC